MVTLSRHMRLAAAVLWTLFAMPAAARAQEVTATARVDSNAITIGDWLSVAVEVLHPENVTLGAPVLPDSIAGFELVKRESSPPAASGGRVLDRTILTVTAFDSGSYVFPPVEIPYTVAGDSTRRVAATGPIAVIVRGIAVDTTFGIKDIKPPLSLPLTFWEILPYLLGALAAAGIVWLILYIRRKRKRGESILPAPPPRPPHEIALEGLAALEADHLWQRGMIKEFHSRVTEIVRSYIELRFSVMALEQTSDEILSAGPIASLPKESSSALRTMLVRADLVKFAKYLPPAEEHDASLASAKAFVESTIARETAAVPASEEVKA